MDVLYRAARVVTGAAGGRDDRPVTGLLVRRDRIEQVGPAEEVAAAVGADTETVDLGDSTIVPGLIDPHCHVTMLAYLLAGVDCSAAAAPSIEAILDRFIDARPGPDGWVVGSGYAEYRLDDRRHPTRTELDGAVPDAPCALFHLSLHLCVVNSAALRALGLDDASEDPPHSWLGRDGNGRLDGRLHEAIALDLLNANIRRHLDAVDGGGRAAFARRTGEHLAALGVTTTSEAAADAGSFVALREAERRGELPVRVGVMFKHAEASWLLRAGMTTGFGSDRLWIGAVKLFCDGGMSSRTAAVDEPYLDPPGERGLLWYDAATLAGIVRACDEAGFQVAVHAQGERGIRTTLEAYAAAIVPGNPNRHRIEHGGCFTPALRAEAARLGVHVVSQPGFLSALGDGYTEAFGAERADSLYPFASLRDDGVLVAGSSDAPVIGASPFVAMRDAMLRRTGAGTVLGERERLSAGESLALYTSSAAFAAGIEERLGTLEAGKLADFVVLDRNPLAVAPESVADSVVLATVVGGRVVHGSLSAPEAVHA